MKLTVNGIEVPYDPTKRLEIVLDTGPDPVEVGPILLKVQGGPCTVRSNEQQEFAVVLEHGNVPVTIERACSPYDKRDYELMFTGAPELTAHTLPLGDGIAARVDGDPNSVIRAVPTDKTLGWLEHGFDLSDAAPDAATIVERGSIPL